MSGFHYLLSEWSPYQINIAMISAVTNHAAKTEKTEYLAVERAGQKHCHSCSLPTSRPFEKLRVDSSLSVAHRVDVS